MAIGGESASVDDWHSLRERGIYIQVVEEPDGSRLWDSERVFVLVWRTADSIRSAEQPLLLHGRVSTRDPSEQARHQGSNTSNSPIEGFRAVLRRPEPRVGAQAVTHTGRRVDCYAFNFQEGATSSHEIDGANDPLYRYLLEVEHVVFPEADYASEGDQEEWFTGGKLRRDMLVWSVDSFAFAESSRSAPTVRTPGYQVPPELDARIKESLKGFGIDDRRSGVVMPYSEFDHNLTGKRLAAHPLHETYIRSDDANIWREIAAKSKKGTLIARPLSGHENSPAEMHRSPDPQLVPPAAIPAMQIAYSSPITRLLKTWAKGR